jgi:RNA polymerase sigma-B factor
MHAGPRYDEAPPRPDKARVAELFRQYATSKDASIRQELVLAHLGLVRYIAGRFSNRGEPMDDLEQVGVVGLIKAVDRFDADRGFEFSTFALPTIVGEIKRHFRDKGWAIHVPRRLQELNLTICRVVEQLAIELGRSPSVEDIAAKVGASCEEVLEAQEISYAYSPRSLDDTGRERESKSSSLAERLGQDDKDLDSFENVEALIRACRELDPRERIVIYLRYVQGMPQVDIAKRFNVSQMSISRAQQRALEKLRRALSGQLDQASGLAAQ